MLIHLPKRIFKLPFIITLFLLAALASQSMAAGTCGEAALTVTGPDTPVDGSQYTASDGTAPYSWCISKGSITQSGVVTVSGHCGSATITVWDKCGNSGTKSIKIGGGWVYKSRTQSQDPACVPFYGSCAAALERSCGNHVVWCPTSTQIVGNLRKDVRVAKCAGGVPLPGGGVNCNWFNDSWTVAYEKYGYSGGDTGLLNDTISRLGLDPRPSTWLLYYDNYEWKYPDSCTEQETACSVPPHTITVNLKGSSEMINPSAGGNIEIAGSISDSYGSPFTWTMTLPNGKTVSGTTATVLRC